MQALLKQRNMKINDFAAAVKTNPNKLEANLSLRQRRKKGSGVRQKEVNGNVIYIGRFDDEKAAAMAYDARAKELFGDYAAPNLPSSKERRQNKAERVAG